MKKQQIYQEIKNNCEGLIRMYVEDLTIHDRKSIIDKEDRKFIHITRETGTALIKLWKLEDFPKDGQTVEGYFNQPTTAQEVIKGQEIYFNHYLNQSPVLFQYYDGKEVKKISRKKAVSIFEANLYSLKNNIQIVINSTKQTA